MFCDAYGFLFSTCNIGDWADVFGGLVAACVVGVGLGALLNAVTH